MSGCCSKMKASAQKKLKINEGGNEGNFQVGENSVPEIPQLNHVVTRNIAKFADFASLKAMRRVDKIWSEGSTPLFRKRLVFVLRTGDRRENAWNLKDFRKMTEKLQPIKNIKIRVLEDWRSRPRILNSQRQQREEKINNILRFVALDLEYLKINIDFPHKLTIPFPNLVKLVLTKFTINSDSNYQELYQNCQNLVELEVDTWAGEIRGDVALSPLLNSDGSRNTALLPKLSAFTSTRPEDIEFLATFPQTWSTLDIRCSTQMIPDLEELLENNKGTLISLTLRGFSHVHFRDVVELNFPDRFSRLQKFEILFPPFYPAKFRMRFGGKKELNYSKTLPALKTLNLCVKKLKRDDLEIFWKTFFKKQVCTTLNFLEIKLKPLYPYPDFHPWIKDEFWYKQQFPNIRVENIKIYSEYGYFR